jgi:hypothetical protein
MARIGREVVEAACFRARLPGEGFAAIRPAAIGAPFPASIRVRDAVPGAPGLEVFAASPFCFDFAQGRGRETCRGWRWGGRCRVGGDVHAARPTVLVPHVVAASWLFDGDVFGGRVVDPAPSLGVGE